jgi:hypothetical protein
MTLNLPQTGISVGITLVVALLVDSGSGGDPAKKAAKAQAYLGVVQALQQIQAGNDAAGIAALALAIQSQNLDPGVALAVQELLSVVSAELTAVQAIADSTIAGQIDTAIAGNLLAAVATALQAYIPPAPAPAAQQKAA